ncbi:MAG: DUF4112 domain-containing protein [Planctomycetales bacterium]
MSPQAIEPVLIADPVRWRSDDEDVELLARWMDSVFEIPGTRIRLGLDAIIGLVPGIGDALTSLVSMERKIRRLDRSPSWNDPMCRISTLDNSTLETCC